MAKIRTIYFMALLSNVDESILKIKLESGFRIRYVPFKKGIELLRKLELGATEVTILKFVMESGLCTDNKRRIYFIKNSIKIKDCIYEKFASEVQEFHNEKCLGYLSNILKKMRLFKEGNVCSQAQYYYYLKKGVPETYFRTGSTLPVVRSIYRLEKEEYSALQEFIKREIVPFKKNYLTLAFKNFELSYMTYDTALSFLSLMIALEVLFNPEGEGELTYRISRYTATLLGMNENDSRKIFKEMKRLYIKRSKIVHAGDLKTIQLNDVLILRHYVREAIKKIIDLNYNKKSLLARLDEVGFGEWK